MRCDTWRAVFFLGASALVWLAGFPNRTVANAQGVAPASGKHVDFLTDVHPIITERCYSCHGGGKSKGGLSLETRDGLIRGGESGPVVVEGKSAESRLIHLISGLDSELVMPPKGERLTEEQIGVLRAWIDQGLVWDASAKTTDGYIAPVALKKVELPPTRGGLDNPVDRLLSPYFDANGVVAPPVAPDNVFARRLYLDIIGLPPTTDELAVFLADTNPDKRAALVRQLLSNNIGYAEHWSTFWNDALRNDFQGTGYIDGGRSQITSWLYGALYSNLPYDQFLTQLINPTDASSGFINGIIWRGVTAAAERPEIQAARSVAQVFLGVNLKCASCHDSFVDHWKLSDAYGLASCFTDEPMELVRCDVPQGQIAEVKFLWPEAGVVQSNLSRSGKLVQLARIVTSEENGHFARAIVNRLWAQFYGRGLVEPLHNIEGKPWKGDSLDWLARDLIENGYNLKKTMERMLTAQAYQWPVVSRKSNDQDDYVFRGPEIRRLSSEQFLDSLSSITGVWQANPQFTPPPSTKKSEEAQVQAQATMARAWRVNLDPLSRALGRPNREQVTLRRESEPSTLQALELTNGATLTAVLKKGAETMLSSAPATPAELVGAVYTKALQRAPSPDELRTATALLGEPVTQTGLEDFLWSIILLPEFQYIQ